jgi:hypothetical protein
VSPTYLSKLYTSVNEYYNLLDANYMDILAKEIEIIFDSETEYDLVSDFKLFNSTRKIITELIRELIRK